ncbi:GatB/YqeY domain-containing protein [Allokutzneria sp. A3M-2-11 16]|uniref:GatB/YqeY domain-containing protein n=1 Tax=Allokutzneria sp. A3M-2-11 16 TaxID=2962043 RepID=UPI0020B78D44|nr:GatB/YqeY domain-containing protein [Allokutzneria sp. A3M-2-11 16]MCP3799842.1 GatB/YqeY domain-containing protein [Allokutzneria sp. A3M-2-11 16]
MAELKARLKSDMTTALKAKDKVVLDTLRMALTAVGAEEVSGKQARELSDDEVLKVLAREAKKRKEAVDAFAAAGRAELADKERAEGEVLSAYLPKQLSDEELTDVVREALAEVTEQVGGKPSPKQMGQVMKAANAKVAGRADGGRVATLVKAMLSQ